MFLSNDKVTTSIRVVGRVGIELHGWHTQVSGGGGGAAAAAE